MFPIIDENIILRKATEKDTDLIFSFINDDEIRKHSFSNELIEYNSHKNWFKNKINSEDYLILIAEDLQSTEFLGQIKYNRIDLSSLLVGIFINDKFSGKGLGTKLLTLTSDLVLKYFSAKEIIAQIKKENIPSIKSFTKAGYQYKNDAIINNSNAIEMVYRKEVKNEQD